VSRFDPAAFAAPLQVPELPCGPVVLRPYAASDLDLVREASADPVIVSISSVPGVCTDAAGRDYIERQRRRGANGEGYSFVIADAHDSSKGLGSIGLPLNEIENGRASVGYWLLERARGRGLAALGLRGLVAFAFGELAIPRLHLFVEPWNVASARTAESAGFRREALLRDWERIDGEQVDVECFAFLYEDWDGSG
jgi:RimJ/RimL family protein N-acetyltransferase